MNKKRNPITSVIATIIGAVVFIGLFVLGLIFFSYLLIIGAIIGLVLFGIGYVRARFFAKKHPKPSAQQRQQKVHQGRTIDHEE